MNTSQSSAREMLAVFGRSLGGVPKVELECSRRMQHGRIAMSGRFSCWLSGETHEDAGPMASLLAEVGAPAVVRAAQADRSHGPVWRHGVGVSCEGDAPELRFYRHSSDPARQTNRYEAWRWQPDGVVRASRYHFAYLPETVEGLRPEDLVDGALRPVVASLVGEERAQQLSGFWLREEGGRLTQLDIALPWRPHALALPAVALLADTMQVCSTELKRALDLHVKHIAFRLGPGAPAATFYASAAATGPWPRDEAELAEQVRRGAAAVHDSLNTEVFARVPARAAASATTGVDLDEFYGGPVARWQTVLGSELHYHAGIFDDGDADPSDDEAEEAMRRAVRELYALLPAGGSIYDVGCGWGGPLAMLVRDLRVAVLGVTISRTQFRHVSSLGLPVRLGDVEGTLPPGGFGAALMLESLCHVRDKAAVLRALRPFCGRLVLRVNCQDAAPASTAFGGSMHMVSSAALREIVEGAGWRIRHWRDRRPEALPSVRVWSRRLASVPASDDPHIETLRVWCVRVLTAPEEWARNNPLIEVMAE